MNLITKGSGISKAQLREQRMKEMLAPLPKLTPKPAKTPKNVLDKAFRLDKSNLEIYTTKGTLRKAQSALDRAFKSDTHYKIKATGELIEKAVWKKQEKNKRVDSWIENGCCARCGRKRNHLDVVTCNYCLDKSKKRLNGNVNVNFKLNSEVFAKLAEKVGSIPKFTEKMLLEWISKNL